MMLLPLQWIPVGPLGRCPAVAAVVAVVVVSGGVLARRAATVFVAGYLANPSCCCCCWGTLLHCSCCCCCSCPCSCFCFWCCFHLFLLMLHAGADDDIDDDWGKGTFWSWCRCPVASMPETTFWVRILKLRSWKLMSLSRLSWMMLLFALALATMLNKQPFCWYVGLLWMVRFPSLYCRWGCSHPSSWGRRTRLKRLWFCPQLLRFEDALFNTPPQC